MRVRTPEHLLQVFQAHLGVDRGAGERGVTRLLAPLFVTARSTIRATVRTALPIHKLLLAHPGRASP